MLTALLLTVAIDVPPAAAPMAAPAPHVPVFTPQAWVRTPGGGEVRRVYPSAALAAGVDGFAAMDCEVAVTGTLIDCAVVGEDPAGAGFGDAILKLSPYFLLRPAARDGVPLRGRRVTVPVHWRVAGDPPPPLQIQSVPAAERREYTAPPVVVQSPPPPPGTPPRNVVTRPDWIRRPDASDVARYYPRAAFERGTEGHAVMRSTVTAQGTLTACYVIAESPAGVGFGGALLKLGRLFAMRPTTADGRSVADAQVDIPVSWKIASPPAPADPNAPPPTSPQAH